MYFTHRYTHDIPMIHDKLMFSQLQGPYRRHLIVGASDANCWELALCETLRNSMEMLSRNLESGPCNDPIAPTFSNPQMKQDPKSVVPAMSTWYHFVCSWMLKFILYCSRAEDELCQFDDECMCISICFGSDCFSRSIIFQSFSLDLQLF